MLTALFVAFKNFIIQYLYYLWRLCDIYHDKMDLKALFKTNQNFDGFHVLNMPNEWSSDQLCPSGGTCSTVDFHSGPSLTTVFKNGNKPMQPTVISQSMFHVVQI